MRVYRMEDKEGQGPYRGSNGRACLGHYDLRRWPPPCDENLPINEYHKTGKHFYCGFSSIEQMKKWFRYVDREQLKKTGFLLAVYECKTRVHEGKKQIGFRRKTSRLLGRFCPVSMAGMPDSMTNSVAN